MPNAFVVWCCFSHALPPKPTHTCICRLMTCLPACHQCVQSHIESGHVGARVRRWARCLERSCALGQTALMEEQAAAAEAAADELDDLDDDYEHAALPYPPPNGSAAWQELLRR